MHFHQPDKTYVAVFLTADNWKGDITNMEPNKCDEVKWFSADNLPINMAPEVKLALENVKNNIFYGELRW